MLAKLYNFFASSSKTPTTCTAPMANQKVWTKSTICFTTLLIPITKKTATRRIQAINGIFLYYSRGVDPCILPACNEISTQ